MTTPLGSQFRDLPTIRLDDQPLDAQWRAPRRRGDDFGTAHKVLVLLAVLVVVLGGIWAGHGFDRRTDRVKAYAPGTEVDLGAMTLTLNRVEVTKTAASAIGSSGAHWAVVAYGTATSKVEKSVFLDKLGLIGTRGGYRTGAELVASPDTGFGMSNRNQLEPGLKDTPVVVTGKLPVEWAPTDHLYVGVYALTLEAHYADQADDQKTWGRGTTVHGFWLPVLRLPDE